METIYGIAENLWTGKTTTYTHHPFGPPYGLEKVCDGVYFFKGFANTIVLETDAGLVIVDPAGMVDVTMKYPAIRKVLQAPLHTAIFTHGHVDHVFGVDDYAAENARNGTAPPRVVAHRLLPERLRRYIRTAGWNSALNSRQFRGGVEKVAWPTRYWWPDLLYEGALDFTVGDQPIQVRHCRGETDDHSWVFFPSQKVLCTGDLFIYAVPNAGNPQKVQRFAGEWADGLKRMAALAPEYLLPGHGFPIVGRERVAEALLNTARLLEHLDSETVRLMNEGADLDRILNAVAVPPDLADLPYLQPVYDESEFIVRNIYRLYGAWYDGQPSHLKPAPQREQANVVAELAGGVSLVMEKALSCSRDGNHRLACQLADWAVLAAPEDDAVRSAAGRIYLDRALQEPSTMAMGIFLAEAARLGAQLPEGHLAAGRIIMAQCERGPFQKI
ncbi:alkyl sulfatase dimerization domain-containing protein [Desulfatitalea alkaliphila]|uniref:MBL fold metallo-hydrolase n=1 Tax=Desulfatitalea alkaliphila TaxID=2929485 RepID=A0AA41UQ44_9BACT|nr:alkyl sulfatase dimerization domain-containing protein [Desulfatitalea alkaliphila]MCJ8501043.1 MBL fold metallo-hydrolase [Desulfatitalea alkaliphila]